MHVEETEIGEHSKQGNANKDERIFVAFLQACTYVVAWLAGRLAKQKQKQKQKFPARSQMQGFLYLKSYYQDDSHEQPRSRDFYLWLKAQV